MSLLKKIKSGIRRLTRTIDMSEEMVPLNDYLKDVRGANERRAGYIAVIYDELSKRYGKDTAFDIMTTAIKDYGRWEAEKRMKESPERKTPDTRLWLPSTEREARIMERKTIDATQDRTVTEVEFCPLIEAWKNMGKTKGEMRILCDIAMYLDEGMSEVYPIAIKTEKRIGWGDECCKFIFEKK